MATLFFSDILRKHGLDPSDVVLIRHAYSDKNFRNCVDSGKIYEYTCHQKRDFRKGYRYWAVFLGETAKCTKFYALYKAGERYPDTADRIPVGMPESESREYKGNNDIIELEKVNEFEEYANKMLIDWGRSPRAWHQKGTKEKEVLSMQG